jgi:hypothetical protein
VLEPDKLTLDLQKQVKELEQGRKNLILNFSREQN